MSDSPKRLTRVLSAMAIVVGLGAGAAASRLPRAARHRRPSRSISRSQDRTRATPTSHPR